ncbi:MAG TPA: 3-dehydroquinate synthase, partial [Verrucomicrobiae bacterium]|nr:3-dehydroquinate synthase [Verrucomicrobiae bacterium]
MSVIERSIQVGYQLRVYFTQAAFDPSNLVVKAVLCGAELNRPPKALMVLDESLAQAQPDLPERIENYFAAHAPDLTLVCPPIIIEGGERTKNSYFHVSEIHSHIDRYHIDRHSYVIGVGGGALLDMVGLAAATAHRGVRHVRV